MNQLTESVSLTLSLGTVLLQIALSIVLILLVLKYKPVSDLIKRHYLVGVFSISLTAIVTSLFYSEYAGFAPCSLCWYQRIFIYPQFILALISLIKKRSDGFSDSVLWLSILGIAIAAYNYYGQMFNPESLPCGAGGAVSCAFIPFTYFGYVTIPMMSFTMFATLIILSLVYKRSN